MVCSCLYWAFTAAGPPTAAVRGSGSRCGRIVALPAAKKGRSKDAISQQLSQQHVCGCLCLAHNHLSTKTGKNRLSTGDMDAFEECWSRQSVITVSNFRAGTWH